MYILEFKPGLRSAVRIIDNWTTNNPWGEPTGLDTGPDNNLYVGIGCNIGPCAQVEGFKPGRGFRFESVGTQPSSTYVGGITTAPNAKL